MVPRHSSCRHLILVSCCLPASTPANLSFIQSALSSAVSGTVLLEFSRGVSYLVGISAQSAPGCAPVEQNHSLLNATRLSHHWVLFIENAHSSLFQPWKLPPKTSAQEVISMDNNPGEVIFRSERTRTRNSFRQNLGIRDPPNFPLRRAGRTATPSIFHTPATLTPTSLFGACKYTLGGCMCASSCHVLVTVP